MNSRSHVVQICGILALVVLLAGCGAFGSAGDDSDRDPYGVDNTTSPELLPGLTENEVTNHRALLENHAETLSNRSYMLEQTTTRTYPNGTVSYTLTETMAVEADGTARVELTEGMADEADDTALVEHRFGEGWGTEEEVLTNFAVNRSDEEPPTFYRQARTKYHFTAFESVERGMSAMDNISISTKAEGKTRYILESAESSPYQYENASLHMVVNEEGYVESYRFAYEELVDSEMMTVVMEVTIDRVDEEITVERPEWVSEAREYFDEQNGASTDDE
ncbi:hypothetical protein [Natronosalvus vescus]|uniref:hypothetical protein n=1 Tax=Natronosalvus vescus TaxID=2953881 RepID=UPI0020910292|nr:hypothetical protein [Natronosalvus vescus]